MSSSKTPYRSGLFLELQALVQDVTRQLKNIGIILGGGEHFFGNASQEISRKLEEYGCLAKTLMRNSPTWV